MTRAWRWGLCLLAACATSRGEERPAPALETPPPVTAPPPVSTPPEVVRRPPPRVIPTQLTGVDAAHRMTLHVLDVGQGSATLLEFPCGAALVDTGGELNDSFDAVAALRAQLDAFFARRTDLDHTLDVVVLTHPHIDHVRGVPMVLATYKVRNIVDNGRKGDTLVRESLEPWWSFAEQNPDHYRAVGNTDELPFTGLQDGVTDPVACAPVDPRIRVLSGGYTADPGWGAREDRKHFGNENNHSVVVRVDLGKASALITGDLEEPALRTLVEHFRGTRMLDVDVYLVGHHGSANGTTRELMDVMTPAVALMSMGPSSRHASWTAWQYGHPRQKVVDLLLEGGLAGRAPVEVPTARGQRQFGGVTVDRAVFGTGWDGAISVDLAEDGSLAVSMAQPAELLRKNPAATPAPPPS